jgi:hypothetical protein
MINHNTLFFIIVLCMPFYIQTMDNSPHSIDIKEYRSDKVIRVCDIQEIAALGNNQLVLKPREGCPYVVDFFSKKQIDILGVFDRYTLINDRCKTRVLASPDWSYAPLLQIIMSKVKIYDSLEKQVISADVPHPNDYDFSKWWHACFDESKPTSLLINHAGELGSYDYKSEEVCFDPLLTELYNDKNLSSHNCIFDPLSQTKKIVSAGPGMFKTDCETASGENKSLGFSAPTAYSDKNYLCNADGSFIIGYSHMATTLRTVDLIEQDYAQMVAISGCYVLNVKKASFAYLCDDRGVMVAPCSMEFYRKIIFL